MAPGMHLDPECSARQTPSRICRHHGYIGTAGKIKPVIVKLRPLLQRRGLGGGGMHLDPERSARQTPSRICRHHQCALGCKPQMCGRLLQEGATKTKRAYRTTHAHHRGEIRPSRSGVEAQSPAGYGRGHCGSVGPSLPRLFGPISPAACRGMRRPGGCLRGLRPNRGFELWVAIGTFTD
jgi:hypothetical protein